VDTVHSKCLPAMNQSVSQIYFVLALTSVLLSAAGQLFMKIGMTRPHVQLALSQGLGHGAWTVLQTVPVLVGLATYGCGAILWLLVLSKLPVSAVYPLVSLAIACVVVIGMVFLHESVSWLRIGGVAVIIAGLLLVGQSA
jgi:multidrug transporter EmrE-like cation transporter